MNRIEKVARAMYPQYDWGVQNHMKELMHDTAKKAIEAMLEPTDEMIEAGCDPFEHIDSQEQVKQSFKNMIQAALKE